MLETDKANTAEYQAFCIARALDIYRDRRRAGVAHSVAYCEAVAYLRRKTSWPDTLASAALAAELAEQPNPI